MSETTVIESETDAPVEADSKKKSVSKKEWLDTDGNVTARLEDAAALRYVTLSTAIEHMYVAEGETGSRAAMCELFGIKTKLTNVASTARNAEEPDDEDEAIADFLAGLIPDQNDDGTSPDAIWRERKPGSVAATKYDKNIIAQALHLAATALEGTEAWQKVERKAKSIEEYLEDLSKRGAVVKVMNMPTIRTAYDELAGVDDSDAVASVL